MAWDTPPDHSRIKLEIYSRLFWMILKGYIFSNFMQRLVLIKREPGVVFTWLLVFGLYCQHLFHNFLRTWVTFALLLILTIPWFYGILLALFVLVQFLKQTNKQKKKNRILLFRVKENQCQMETVFHPATILHPRLMLSSPQNQPGSPSVHKVLSN